MGGVRGGSCTKVGGVLEVGRVLEESERKVY